MFNDSEKSDPRFRVRWTYWMDPPSANDHERPAKRPRTILDVSSRPSSTGAVVQVCHFAKLPYDLVAEILIQTQNPKDVLSVARCSKTLCWMLTDSSANYIWKHARQTCFVGPMPAPIGRFTESSWAAWVFDGGPCEICGKYTDEMRISYALNVRACRDFNCKTQVKAWNDKERASIYGFQDINNLLQYIPVMEFMAFRFQHNLAFGIVGLHDINLVRRVEWDKINEEFEDVRLMAGDNWVPGEPDPLPNRERPPLPNLNDLLVWQQRYEQYFQTLKGQIGALTHQFAAKEGYCVADLENSPTFQSLVKKCVKARRPVHGEDIWPWYEGIDKEVRTIAGNRSRREKAKMEATTRRAISRFYDDLQRQGTSSPLPAFSTFCQQIPIISSITKHSVNNSPAMNSVSIAAALTTEAHLVRSIFFKELKEWQNKARTGLSEVLGCGDWEYAGKSMDDIHPTKNIGARFKCSNPGCAKLADKYRFLLDAGSLSYAQAIAHECVDVRNGKRKKVRRWDPSNFVRDETTISALKQFVHQTWDASGEVIRSGMLVCKACTPHVVMTVNDVPGHAQRHEEMEIEVIDSEEKMNAAFAVRNKQPLEHGLTFELLGPAYYQDKRKFTAQHNYRCVYCAPKVDASKGELRKPFDFNGLRSHLKAKHKIIRPRDEDYYTDIPISKPDTTPQSDLTSMI